MDKQKVDMNLFCLPCCQTILGTRLDGKDNFMALGWVTRVNFKPPMLGICVNRNHASNRAVRESGQFSVNVPPPSMIEVTDYVGIVSGAKVDKSELFEVFHGELESAPLIRECPLNIECRVVETVDLPTNTFFIGEMVNIYSSAAYLSDDKPDWQAINPFMLTMPDNNFWALGDKVGNAWRDGVKMKKRLESKG